MTEVQRKTWREPMVWLVFGLPLAVIIAGISTLVIAIQHRDGGVVLDDVKRSGQMQETDLSADEKARMLGLNAMVRETGGHLEVWPVTGTLPTDQTLKLVAEHPTDAAQDRSVEVWPVNGDHWRSHKPFEDVHAHDWKFTLSPMDGRWRLRGRLARDQQSAVLAPALAD